MSRVPALRTAAAPLGRAWSVSKAWVGRAARRLWTDLKGEDECEHGARRFDCYDCWVDRW